MLAGGQSLVPLLAMRLARPAHLVDINGVDGAGRHRGRRDGVAIGATDPRTRRRAVAARRRADAGAGRGAAVHRPRLDPQPWHHRRQHRPRRRVGRAARGRGGHRGRDGRACPCGRAGRAGRRLLRRALHHDHGRRRAARRGPVARPGPPARAGRSTRSSVATATSRSSASPPWSRSTTSGASARPASCLIGVADRPVRGADGGGGARRSGRRRRTRSPPRPQDAVRDLEPGVRHPRVGRVPAPPRRRRRPPGADHRRRASRRSAVSETIEIVGERRAASRRTPKCG